MVVVKKFGGVDYCIVCWVDGVKLSVRVRFWLFIGGVYGVVRVVLSIWCDWLCWVFDVFVSWCGLDCWSDCWLDGCVCWLDEYWWVV